MWIKSTTEWLRVLPNWISVCKVTEENKEKDIVKLEAKIEKEEM